MLLATAVLNRFPIPSVLENIAACSKISTAVELVHICFIAAANKIQFPRITESQLIAFKNVKLKVEPSDV